MQADEEVCIWLGLRRAFQKLITLIILGTRVRTDKPQHRFVRVYQMKLLYICYRVHASGRRLDGRQGQYANY